MGFSYNEMMLGFHPRISLEIRPDITKMEKYLDLGFSMGCSTPQDPSDVQLSSPNSPCNYPNDIDTSCLFFCIFVTPANMLCWTSSYSNRSFDGVNGSRGFRTQNGHWRLREVLNGAKTASNLTGVSLLHLEITVSSHSSACTLNYPQILDLVVCLEFAHLTQIGGFSVRF